MLHCKRRLMWNISKNMNYTPGYFFRRNRDLGKSLLPRWAFSVGAVRGISDCATANHTRISRDDGGCRRANIQLDGALVLEESPYVMFEDDRSCGTFGPAVDGCAYECECRLVQCVSSRCLGCLNQLQVIANRS